MSAGPFDASGAGIDRIPADNTRRPGERWCPALAMWGSLLVAGAVGLYLSGVVLAAVQRLLGFDQVLSAHLVWASGAPILLGIVLVLLDVALIAPRRRMGREVFDEPLQDLHVTAVLTAFNDELSIGQAVDDFLGHPLVRRVVVVDNRSTDATSAVARAHGAVVHVEEQPGYGRCVHRALREAAVYKDTHLVALCEGDMTFRAADLDKLVAYARHAHVVNGTRIVEQLRARHTQLTPFMYHGNFAFAKVLELKHLGKGTLSDLGTTYKLCRSEVLRERLGMFDPRVNLEFNAHFLDRVLGSDLRLVEVPVTFYPRVGQSKGGNTSNWRATRVGLRMLWGILWGWRGYGGRGDDDRLS